MKPITMKALLAGSVALLLSAAPAAAAAPISEFDGKSLAAIRSAHAGKPFVLAFWSVHCEPCREELAQLGAVARRHPDVPIILVAADPPRDRAAVTRILGSYDLRGVQQWAYADDFEERIRYAVDPAWRGELPRTYLYDSRHQPEGHTGAALPALLDPWIARQMLVLKAPSKN